MHRVIDESVSIIDNIIYKANKNIDDAINITDSILLAISVIKPIIVYTITPVLASVPSTTFSCLISCC